MENLLELQNAFLNGLFKSTIIISASIIEALLINALYEVREDAEIDYYKEFIRKENGIEKKKRYYQGKNNYDSSGKPIPPDIDRWNFWQILKITNKNKIIPEDVCKYCRELWWFRNSVHLYSQFKRSLEVGEGRATIARGCVILVNNVLNDWFNVLKKNT